MKFEVDSWQLGDYLGQPFVLGTQVRCLPDDSQSTCYLRGTEFISYREVKVHPWDGNLTRIVYVKPGAVTGMVSEVNALARDILNDILWCITNEKPIHLFDGLLFFRGHHVQSDAVITLWNRAGYTSLRAWIAEDQDRYALHPKVEHFVERLDNKFDDKV